MKTTIKRTVNLGLIVALLCPLNMAMAQKSFSFSGSSFKGGKTAVSKPSAKKSLPSRVGSKPIRYNPINKGKAVSKVPPRVSRKTPIRPYTPSKLPGKKVSPFKPYPITKPLPRPIAKPITKPLPRPIVKPFPLPITKPLPQPIAKPLPLPIVKPFPQPIDLTGETRLGDRVPRAVGNAREERRQHEARRERAPQGEVEAEPVENGGADNGAPEDNGGDAGNANCPHHCHGVCNHHGVGFGLDFPRWGFSYGPNGIFIRGGGRYYDNGPRDVVIVDQPIVVEQAAPIVQENVEIREVANLPEVHVASTISLSSKTSLGDKTGQVILDINGIALPTAVRSWTTESTTCTLPMIGLDKPKEARLVMLTADGQVAHSISVLLLPAKAPEVAPME